MNPHEHRDTHAVDRIPTRSLLEGLGRIYDLVLVTDHDGCVLWISNGLSELCGGADFHVGRDAQSILPQLPVLPRPEQVFTLRSRLRQEGYLSDVHVDLATRDGRSMPVQVNILPVSVPVGRDPFYVVIARPVEESGALRPSSSGDVFASILDDSPGAVLAIDEHGYVSFANSAAEQLLGHARSHIVDRPVAALLDDAAGLERLVSSLGAQGVVNEIDLTLVRSDGGEVQVSASARNRPGSGAGTVLCLHDVTEPRAAAAGLESKNQELESKNAELEGKNAELEHCVLALAHDLRSPLVALLGFSRLLRQDYGERLDDTGAHFLDRIEQAGRTMEDLIHDLLELSRIGQPGERRALIDPSTVLNQLLAEVKPRLDSARIRLVHPTNPPLIYCDRTRLYQVFSNLIGNAIDHMGSSEDAEIVVTIHDEDHQHHIVVSDAGRGIPEEDHDRVFDVFQSFGPAADGRRGSGIGLAIVKKIAETHGGRVWLESRPGAGASFHVTFPHP